MHTMSLSRPDLRPSSPVPLYEQIVRHITAAVASGDLRPGDKVPAWRDLAEDWEVGQTTIARAMEVLRERGVLVSTHGKGTFVADPQPPASKLPAPRPDGQRQPSLDSYSHLRPPPSNCTGLPLSTVARMPQEADDDEHGPRFAPGGMELVYMQIADDIESQIRSGRYRHGDRLPGRADLAAEYGAAPMTVRRAQRELVERGLLRLVQGKGAFVDLRGTSGAHDVDKGPQTTTNDDD